MKDELGLIVQAPATKDSALHESSNGSEGTAKINASLVEKKEKVKVLIVDDLPHKLTALEAILAQEDLLLVKANSGSDALRHLLRENFALILMDVQMPAMDGFETAALIRQRKRSEHIPIIFITANIASDANISMGYSLGAVDYIPAPVVPEILKAKVAVFVELYRINHKVRLQAMELRSYNLDLKMANRKLEQQAIELQSSRENFRNIVEKNVEGVAVADLEGVIRFVNPAFANLMGNTIEGLVGQPFHFMKEVGKPFEMDLVFDETAKIPVEIFLTETQWENRKAYLVHLRDITARRNSEEALKQSEEKLRQAQRMESIGRLAGGIAHDFNNLLTAINGYTELSLDCLEEGHPVKANLVEVRRSGDRAAELTQQLLAYSRKQILLPKLLNLNVVVNEMTNMLRRLIGENIELVSRLDPNLGMVNADHGQLEQVLMNLLVNAKDAMPTGGRIVVETSVERLEANHESTQSRNEDLSTGDEYVVLTVTDTGMGMDEATKDQIFEPFFTTKEVGKGTGLGLSMVYGFLQQSGGSITVATTPGKGSTFKIFLPQVSDSTVGKPGPASDANIKAGRGEIILLVEDDGSVRRFLLNVLEKSGYQVLEAEHGQQALALSENYPHPIQLLVTDVMMPNMGGEELAARLVKRWPDMKVLFISGYTDEVISTNELFAHESMVLQKPFSPGVISKKIREVLDSTNKTDCH